MTADGIHPAAADGFGQAADAYEAARPSYPPEVVDAIVARAALAPGRSVVDVAAGTGKLTRLLVASGADVLAVEPVPAMRAALAAAVPSVVVLDGTAEALPLADATVDAVTVAQAFHWFDQPAALAEAARVLRPGGTLALLWNLRDTEVPWVRAWGDLLVDGDLDRPYEWYYGVDYAAVIDTSGRFGPVEVVEASWAQPVDEHLVVDRAASVSVMAALDDMARAEVLDRVQDLCRNHPDLAGRDRWDFPYRTVAYLATVRDGR